ALVREAVEAPFVEMVMESYERQTPAIRKLARIGWRSRRCGSASIVAGQALGWRAVSLWRPTNRGRPLTSAILMLAQFLVAYAFGMDEVHRCPPPARRCARGDHHLPWASPVGQGGRGWTAP